MKNFNYIIAFLAIIGLIGCDATQGVVFEDTIVGFNTDNSQLVFLRDGSGPVASGITVDLIGAPQNEAINFSFTVDPSSTAIEGTHFTVDGSTGTIPANSLSGTVPITILPDNIDVEDNLTLTLNLSSDSGVAPFAETASFTVQVTCPNTIPLDRTWTITIIEGAFGAASTRNDVTITDAGDGTLLVSDITAGVLPALGCCDPDEPANILNICDEITIARPAMGASFGYETNAAAGFGPGSWNPDSQVLTINWWEPGNGFGAIVELFPN